MAALLAEAGRARPAGPGKFSHLLSAGIGCKRLWAPLSASSGYASCFGFCEDYADSNGIFAYRRATAWIRLKGVETDGLRNFLTRMPKSQTTHGQAHHYCSPHSDAGLVD